MRLRKLLIIVTLIIPLYSCVKKNQVPISGEGIEESAQKQENLKHKVSYSGETLALIASWYTGKAANWKALKDANPGLKPERITIGQEIIIPAKLLKERKPMSKKYLQDYIDKIKSSPKLNSSVEQSLNPVEVTKPEIKDAKKEDGKKEEALLKENSQESTTLEAETERVITNETLKPNETKPATADEERERLLDELLQQ